MPWPERDFCIVSRVGMNNLILASNTWRDWWRKAGKKIFALFVHQSKFVWWLMYRSIIPIRPFSGKDLVGAWITPEVKKKERREVKKKSAKKCLGLNMQHMSVSGWTKRWMNCNRHEIWNGGRTAPTSWIFHMWNLLNCKVCPTSSRKEIVLKSSANRQPHGEWSKTIGIKPDPDRKNQWHAFWMNLGMMNSCSWKISVVSMACAKKHMLDMFSFWTVLSRRPSCTRIAQCSRITARVAQCSVIYIGQGQ